MDEGEKPRQFIIDDQWKLRVLWQLLVDKIPDGRYAVNFLVQHG
jgi:hypothetical protein